MANRLCPSHQCKNCGEIFIPEDRIVELYVVEGVGVDVEVGAPAVRCAGEAEYAHHDCSDRNLSKGRKLGSLVTLS